MISWNVLMRISVQYFLIARSKAYICTHACTPPAPTEPQQSIDIISCQCVPGKSGALISNLMSVFMLSKVYISPLSQKRNKNIYYS